VDRTWIAVTVKSALRQFYRDGGVAFWRAYENDPEAAVGAFIHRPQDFGAVQIFYDFAPLIMKREHQRITGLLALYREKARVGASAAAPVDGAKP
jgi:hypothetical protein